MKTIFLFGLTLLTGCEALWGAWQKPHVELARPSRSSPIAVAEDDSVLVAVSPDHGSISIFRIDADEMAAGETRKPTRSAVVPTGREPWAVVIHPDRTTAFVANRGDATVVKIEGLDTPVPRVTARVEVGAEPSGLALSPRGRRLFVAEHGESSIAVLDTESMQLHHVLHHVRNPRALVVTNNANSDEDDERLIAPEYFGELKTEGEGPGQEMPSDRIGLVRLWSLADYAELPPIALSPLAVERAGFAAAAAPNQLAGAAIADDGRLYIAGTAVSPEPPLAFDRSVNPVVHVIDLAAGAEVAQGLGSFSLAQRLAAKQKPALRYAADPVDIEFVVDKSVGYVVARGAQAVLRVFADEATGMFSVGSLKNDQIDLGACEAPIGGAIGRATVVNQQRMFVNCWLSRRLVVIDLKQQVVESAVPLVDDEPLPPQVLAGKRAFYSARGRMSRDGWMSCASCHPDGRSDGVTWSFPTGPRQSSALDGTYFGNPGSQPRSQRALGWTANFDEVHDFEWALRSVMGGNGNLIDVSAAQDCGDLQKERPRSLHPHLGAPNRELQAPGGCGAFWDEIEAFLLTLRPAMARRRLDAGAVARGRGLFISGGACHSCHGGAGYTVSHLFYTPSMQQNDQLLTVVPFLRPAAWPASYTFHNGRQLADQPAVADANGSIGPLQIACAIRNVGTFGSDALERNDFGTRAQGRGGYNVPSLYSLGLTAPYLHHGGARDLDALLASPRFAAHLRAGAENFSLDDTQRADLISFLLSIDAATPPPPAPAGFDSGCATE